MIERFRSWRYDAFTTAEGLDAWFTAGTRVDAWTGDEMRFRWQDWGLDHLSGDPE